MIANPFDLAVSPCDWPLYPGHGGAWSPDGEWRLSSRCPRCGAIIWGPVEPDINSIGFRDSAILRRDRIMERLYRRFHGAERYLPTIKQPPTVLQRSAQPLALY